MESQQTIELKDFAGGITDNIVQGDINRAQYIDNYFILNDHSLEERPGFLPIDTTNYQLPSGNNRVTSMFSFLNESILMFNSSRHIYYLTPEPSLPHTSTSTLAEILGEGGNEVLSGGDKFSQVSYAEFQKKVYFASDGINNLQGIKPSKIYKDLNDSWTAKTAGLPRTWSPGSYTNTSLLGKCISLANAIKVAFLAHYQDGPTSNTAPYDMFLHSFYDDVDTNILFFIPNATDLQSLFTLIGYLNSTFSNHVNDANESGVVGRSVVEGFYHIPTDSLTNIVLPGDTDFAPAKGPNVGPSDNSTPTIVSNYTEAQLTTALTRCASQLDDLYVKYNWHRMGWYTHSLSNDPVFIDRHPILETKVGRVNIGNTYPVITPDWTDFYNFVNAVKGLINYHLTGTVGRSHTQNVYYPHRVNLPNCTDLDSAFLLIYWCRAVWDLHTADASIAAYTNMTASSTAALTAGVQTIVITGADTTAGQIVYISGGFVASDNSSVDVAVVTTGAASGGNTKVDRLTSRNLSSDAGQVSGSLYHVNQVAGVLTTATTSQITSAEKLTTAATAIGDTLVGTSNSLSYDINSWIALAAELFYAVYTHASANVFNQHPSAGFSWDTQFLAGTYAGFFIPQAETAAYAFYYSDEYVVGQNGLTYLTLSNPVLSDSIQVAVSYPVGTLVSSLNVLIYPDAVIATTRTNEISNIPTLTNTNDTNYDTTNIKYNVARTTDGGSTFYVVGFVENGTTTYTDQTNDTIPTPGSTALNQNALMYTNGGVVGYDQPPQAKFIEIVNNTVYYGWITDTGQDFPNRIRQSLPFAPDHAPATFYDDFEEEITGLGRARSNLVIFCKNSIYRESGGFTNIGTGTLVHERISDAIGALNNKSIVKTEIGLFFAGNDGFYYTDGFQLIKISLELDRTYLKLTTSKNQKRSIYGAYDKITRRVWWSMKKNETDIENNISYVYYLDFGVKPSGVFTTVSNGILQTQSGVNYYQPSSMVFMGGVCYYGHGNGYVLFGDVDNKADAKIDTTTAAANWITTYIPFNYTSCAIDLGTNAARKYLTKLHVLGKNTGYQDVQINVIRDLNFDGQGIKPMAIVNYLENMYWADHRIIWDDPTQGPTLVWNPSGRMDLWRRFPQSALRASLVQVQLVPGLVACYSSSQDYPAGCNTSVDSTLKTATILTPTAYSAIVWPLDVVDYVISFQTDGYVNEFTITAIDVTKTILTFSDSGNLSTTSAGCEWVIRGYKKNQRSSVKSMVIYYQPQGDKYQRYTGLTSSGASGGGGENPS